MKSRIDCSKTIDFFKEKKRLCKSQFTCEGCPLERFSNCETPETTELNEMIKELQKWSDGKVRTKAYDVIQYFPNVQSYDGIPAICPKIIDKTIEWDCPDIDCPECQKQYFNGPSNTKAEKPEAKESS